MSKAKLARQRGKICRCCHLVRYVACIGSRLQAIAGAHA
jgi:hypothetical protein